jgi:hypothetical protein
MGKPPRRPKRQQPVEERTRAPDTLTEFFRQRRHRGAVPARDLSQGGRIVASANAADSCDLRACFRTVISEPLRCSSLRSTLMRNAFALLVYPFHVTGLE